MPEELGEIHVDARRRPIRSVAVFCGARSGHDPAHAAAARAMGAGLALARIELVYGGGSVGLMREVADAALAGGAAVRGILPRFLLRAERPHPGVQLELVDSMHARKTRMFELADAFVTLPGGLGTLDETVEMLTWRLLGLHEKPIIIVDAAGSASPFLSLIEALTVQGFVGRSSHRLFQVVADAAAALAVLAAGTNFREADSRLL